MGKAIILKGADFSDSGFKVNVVKKNVNITWLKKDGTVYNEEWQSNTPADGAYYTLNGKILPNSSFVIASINNLDDVKALTYNGKINKSKDKNAVDIIAFWKGDKLLDQYIKSSIEGETGDKIHIVNGQSNFTVPVPQGATRVTLSASINDNVGVPVTVDLNFMEIVPNN